MFRLTFYCLKTFRGRISFLEKSLNPGSRYMFVSSAFSHGSYLYVKGTPYIKSSQSLIYRKFHLTPRRDVHPFVWVVLRPLFKFAAVLTGRGFRKWWKDLPPHKRKYFLGLLRQNKVKVGAVAALMGLSMLYYYASHLQETPITGRKRFMAFNAKQFQEIGEMEFKQVCSTYEKDILPSNHHLTKRVATVVNWLLAANKDIDGVSKKHWTIAVVDSSMENAFVLPNGEIFVFVGMLKLCTNNDQLGTVLAHEMSHCILGHGGENFSVYHLVDFVMVIIIASIWAILPSDILALVTHWLVKQLIEILLHLPYNRKIETEADEVGLILAAKACLDIRESSAFWSKMAALNKNFEDVPDVEFLSTHPSHEKRSMHLDSKMEEALKLRSECGCPRLKSRDPRLDIEKLTKMLEDQRRKYRANMPVTIVVPGLPPR